MSMCARLQPYACNYAMRARACPMCSGNTKSGSKAV